MQDEAPRVRTDRSKAFSQPDVDHEIYRRLAIVEFAPNPEVKKRKNITHVFEDELSKQGYDIVSMDEFNSVLEESGFSSDDLSDPEVLNRISEKLNISAIFPLRVTLFRDLVVTTKFIILHFEMRWVRSVMLYIPKKDLLFLN